MSLWRRASEPRRIGLVGCVSQKTDRPRPAKDLYTSALFAGRRAYVEATCAEWWILSAKHGLVSPDEPLDPYDQTLTGMGHAAKRQWAENVLAELERAVRPRPDDIFELHAGAAYRDFGLVDGLRRRGCLVENPTEGLGIGRQLRFYKEARL